MAASTNTVDFQLVTVPVPGTSIALNPQPYDNTHTIIFYNAGANACRVAIAAPGGAIAAGGGADLPVGAALVWAIGAIQWRPGPPFLGANRVVVDSVGGAGNVTIQLINANPPVGPS